LLVCSLKGGVIIYPIFLFILYLRNKELSFFIFFSVLFFHTLIFNPQTSGIDLGLLSIIRITDLTLFKASGDITTQAAPMFLLFILSHTVFSKKQ